MTEQGETIAVKYSNPANAAYHLESLEASVALATARLAGLGWAAMALVVLTLIAHEPDAPQGVFAWQFVHCAQTNALYPVKVPTSR